MPRTFLGEGVPGRISAHAQGPGVVEPRSYQLKGPVYTVSRKHCPLSTLCPGGSTLCQSVLFLTTQTQSGLCVTDMETEPRQGKWLTEGHGVSQVGCGQG